MGTPGYLVYNCETVDLAIILYEFNGYVYAVHITCKVANTRVTSNQLLCGGYQLACSTVGTWGRLVSVATRWCNNSKEQRTVQRNAEG